MTLNNMYTSLFLLALSWHLSSGIPVHAPRSLDADKCATFSSLSKTLLEKNYELLTNTKLFSGFNCLNQQLEINSNTQTVLACSPSLDQDKACMAGRTTSFNEHECLGNITMDLGFYSRELGILQQNNTELLQSHPDSLAAVRSMQELLQKHTTSPAESKATTIPAPTSCSWTDKTFDNRLCVCKKLTGFQARLVTICRACSYITSGDHK